MRVANRWCLGYCRGTQGRERGSSSLPAIAGYRKNRSRCGSSLAEQNQSCSVDKRSFTVNVGVRLRWQSPVPPAIRNRMVPFPISKPRPSAIREFDLPFAVVRSERSLRLTGNQTYLKLDNQQRTGVRSKSEAR